MSNSISVRLPSTDYAKLTLSEKRLARINNIDPNALNSIKGIESARKEITYMGWFDRLISYICSRNKEVMLSHFATVYLNSLAEKSGVLLPENSTISNKDSMGSVDYIVNHCDFRALKPDQLNVVVSTSPESPVCVQFTFKIPDIKDIDVNELAMRVNGEVKSKALLLKMGYPAETVDSIMKYSNGVNSLKTLKHDSELLKSEMDKQLSEMRHSSYCKSVFTSNLEDLKIPEKLATHKFVKEYLTEVIDHKKTYNRLTSEVKEKEASLKALKGKIDKFKEGKAILSRCAKAQENIARCELYIASETEKLGSLSERIAALSVNYKLSTPESIQVNEKMNMLSEQMSALNEAQQNAFVGLQCTYRVMGLIKDTKSRINPGFSDESPAVQEKIASVYQSISSVIDTDIALDILKSDIDTYKETIQLVEGEIDRLRSEFDGYRSLFVKLEGEEKAKVEDRLKLLNDQKSEVEYLLSSYKTNLKNEQSVFNKLSTNERFSFESIIFSKVQEPGMSKENHVANVLNALKNNIKSSLLKRNEIEGSLDGSKLALSSLKTAFPQHVSNATEVMEFPNENGMDLRFEIKDIDDCNRVINDITKMEEELVNSKKPLLVRINDAESSELAARKEFDRLGEKFSEITKQSAEINSTLSELRNLIPDTVRVD
ncbi:hypothetical protein [Yokenella regensburgei]|uniref:hypothetical protein n=1 Tax=Yokenella regensburgei TaxID=158877 RepID=UPI0014333B2E|nr:hypothetical protein [Yokenella regensburgei]QIU92593.1 hypothetical protein HEC60_25155 [Yokenella regensburgei]